jgi:hypothetical protein
LVRGEESSHGSTATEREEGLDELERAVKESLIVAVMDWPTQKIDFEPDGSLRDIYVQAATVADWEAVVSHILDGSYSARLDRCGTEVAVPADFERLFDGNDRHWLSFTVGGVVLDCYFFTPTEIELSFAPSEVTASGLRALLELMIDIGDTIMKPVLMTPENGPQSPIFRYDPNANLLRWLPADESLQ